MASRSPIRVLFSLTLGLASGSLMGQVQKPSPGEPLNSPAPSALPVETHSKTPPAITFHEGKLAIQANGSSLDQILRTVSQKTGIKVTGDVADEPVYGRYGPGTPDSVLGDLLDGTGTNVLLVPATDQKPGELFLTPQHGGPTPPDPNALAREEQEDRLEQVSRPIHRPVAPPPIPPPPQQGTHPGVTAGANTSGANNSNSQSPNGVKTPQQIFEELQRLRQQQSNPQ